MQAVCEIVGAAGRNIADRHLPAAVQQTGNHFIKRSVTTDASNQVGLPRVFFRVKCAIPTLRRRQYGTNVIIDGKGFHDIRQILIRSFGSRAGIHNNQRFFFHLITPSQTK